MLIEPGGLGYAARSNRMLTLMTQQDQPLHRGGDRRRGSGRRVVRDRRQVTNEVPSERRSQTDRRTDSRRDRIERRTPPKGFPDPTR